MKMNSINAALTRYSMFNARQQKTDVAGGAKENYEPADAVKQPGPFPPKINVPEGEINVPDEVLSIDEIQDIINDGIKGSFGLFND